MDLVKGSTSTSDNGSYKNNYYVPITFDLIKTCIGRTIFISGTVINIDKDIVLMKYNENKEFKVHIDPSSINISLGSKFLVYGRVNNDHSINLDFFVEYQE